MGVKILIITACQVLADEGTRHADVAETVDTTREEAVQLARQGRALFLDKGDDPTKGQLTASKDDVESTRRHAKLIAAEREERAQAAQLATPGGMAALVAAQVAAAVQAALKPAA